MPSPDVDTHPMRSFALACLLVLSCARVNAGLVGPGENEPEDGFVPPAASPSSILAPLVAEQEAAVEHELRRAGVTLLLRSSIDSRGPGWAHNAAQVNAADHAPRLDDQSQIDALLKSIEVAAQVRETRGTTQDAAPPHKPLTDTVETVVAVSDNLFRHMPRAVVQWVKDNREFVSVTSIALLLLGSAAATFRERATRKRRRRRARDSVVEAPQPRERRRHGRHRHSQSPESRHSAQL